jgi:hypothetical protein
LNRFRSGFLLAFIAEVSGGPGVGFEAQCLATALIDRMQRRLRGVAASQILWMSCCAVNVLPEDFAQH